MDIINIDLDRNETFYEIHRSASKDLQVLVSLMRRSILSLLLVYYTTSLQVSVSII